MYVLVIELLVMVLVAWFIATQIIAPVLAGRPLFPMFSRASKLHDELAKVRQARDERELEKTIAAEKSKLKKRSK